MTPSKSALFGLAMAAASVMMPLCPALAVTWVVGIPQAAVREYIGGPVLFTLHSGTVVALTGRCSGGLNLGDIANKAPWHQQWRLSHHWCETEPLLGSRGWIYGGYLAPGE